MKKLVDKNVLTERDLDIKRLKPFRLTQKRMEIGRDRTSGLKWCYGSLVQLEKMARAMGHLVCLPFRILLCLKADDCSWNSLWECFKLLCESLPVVRTRQAENLERQVERRHFETISSSRSS